MEENNVIDRFSGSHCSYQRNDRTRKSFNQRKEKKQNQEPFDVGIDELEICSRKTSFISYNFEKNLTLLEIMN